MDVCSSNNLTRCFNLSSNVSYLLHISLFPACPITSITSPSASTLNVKWSVYSGATNYFLDLRVVNSTTIAPVVVTLTASSTEKLVQGLRPGTTYDVTLKVFQFYYVMCTQVEIAMTGNSSSSTKRPIQIMYLLLITAH